MVDTEQGDRGSGDGPRKVNVLDYFVIIAKYKRIVVRTTLCSFVGCLVVFWLILPRWYKSTAVVMPPKQGNPLGLMSTLSRATSSLRSLGLGAPTDELSQFMTILASRRVHEDVILRFKLQEVYDIDIMEKTIRELESNVEVSLGKEDVSVEIAVYDTDPQRAADMANYFVGVLNKVYIEMSVTEARGNREFLEKRYLQALSDLKQAEEEFREFQEKYSVYSVPDQLKAAVNAAAVIQSQITVKEVELGIIARTTSADNPERERVELELRELRKQLFAMKTGRVGSDSSLSVFTPFDKAPKIGMEFVRLYRDMEIQGKILELLMPLYEQSKIEEQRDTPSVIVLDNGVPAEKASKPKRAILTVLLTGASFLFTFVIVLYFDRLQSARANRSNSEAEKIALIVRELHWRNLLR